MKASLTWFLADFHLNFPDAFPQCQLNKQPAKCKYLGDEKIQIHHKTKRNPLEEFNEHLQFQHNSPRQPQLI